jgi:peptidoglycan/LPS O-acetylase OafA/YrhL
MDLSSGYMTSVRINVKSIQFLRFIAAILVVLSHSIDDVKFFITDTSSPLTYYLADFGRSGGPLILRD